MRTASSPPHMTFQAGAEAARYRHRSPAMARWAMAVLALALMPSGAAIAEEPLTSAEAVKHSVLAHPAFWLIPDRQGCVATTTRGPGTPPASAPVPWDANVWVCSFVKDFGVARCQSVSHVDLKTRKSAAFAEPVFTVRPDRSPMWAATFGGLTEAFVSDHQNLVTNARREYLLQTDTFKSAPPTSIHTVCTGRWDPMTAKDLAELGKNGNARDTAKGGATPSPRAE